MSTAYIGDMETRERFPSAEIIDKIAEASNIPVSILFLKRGCPGSIKETVAKVYEISLKDELFKRLLNDVKEVCKML